MKLLVLTGLSFLVTLLLVTAISKTTPRTQKILVAAYFAIALCVLVWATHANVAIIASSLLLATCACAFSFFLRRERQSNP